MGLAWTELARGAGSAVAPGQPERGSRKTGEAGKCDGSPTESSLDTLLG